MSPPRALPCEKIHPFHPNGTSFGAHFVPLFLSHSTSWLAPEEGAVTIVGEGIDECLALLKTDFSMRGFAIRNEAREIGVDVSSAAGFCDAAAYRRLEWSDVGALAQAESVDLVRQADRVTMHYPVAGIPHRGPLPR